MLSVVEFHDSFKTLDLIQLAGCVRHCFLGYAVFRVRMYAFGVDVPLSLEVGAYAFEKKKKKEKSKESQKK